MHFLYNISIHFYHLFIKVAALFNSKAKRWVEGREGLFESLKETFDKIHEQDKFVKIVWFHCASLGEFEQGRTLIERVKQQNEVKIILTFFSPSGYEVRKNYQGADWVFYLPIDTKANADKFISIVQPQVAFFVKYEFWFNYLNQLRKRGTPAYLVSGIFRENQHFFKFYGKWFSRQLKCFKRFFVQDYNSKDLLNSLGYINVTISGDTRFDRVYEIAQKIKPNEIVEEFVADKEVLIAGSSWIEDIKVLSDIDLKKYKLIVAPHEISEENIETTAKCFEGKSVIKYSDVNGKNVNDAQVLVIDNLGLLSSLYQYGNVAFIGGGFGKGIHNILEAATFGMPVMFGPNYDKFKEAKELIQKGGAFTVKNSKNFIDTMELLSDKSYCASVGEVCKGYIESKRGAVDQILEKIKI